MKLISISNSTKRKIKKAIRDMKNQIIYGMVLVTIANAGTVGAVIDYSRRTKVDNTYSISQNDNKRNTKRNNRVNGVNLVYTSAINTDININDDHINIYDMAITSDVDKDEGATNDNNYDDERETGINQTYEEKNALNKELLESVKKHLLDYVNNAVYNEISDKDLLEIEKNDFKPEITMDNIDFYSMDEIIKFICEKYNLTEFEFKVIASTVYHETFANNYDDAYRVINTIYNRTKSKKWVDWISSVTGLDGTSMYAQVIASGQFDGCVRNSGYDFDELLNTVIYDGTKPFETTLAAIFDFLISEKSVHNFLSFKGIYWKIDESEKMKDGYGITNWVKYTKLGNVYHNPLSQSDLIDPEYELVSVQENKEVLTKKRG